MAGVGGSLSTAPGPASSPISCPSLHSESSGKRTTWASVTENTRRPWAFEGLQVSGTPLVWTQLLLTPNQEWSRQQMSSSRERNSWSNKFKFLMKSFISRKLQKGNPKVITLQVMGCLFFFLQILEPRLKKKIPVSESKRSYVTTAHVTVTMENGSSRHKFLEKFAAIGVYTVSSSRIPRQRLLTNQRVVTAGWRVPSQGFKTRMPI